MSFATNLATSCACMPKIDFPKRARFPTQALAYAFKDRSYIRIWAFFGPRPLGWVYKALVGLLGKYGSFCVPVERVYHSKTKLPMDPILSRALLPNPNQHSKVYPSPKCPWRAHPKRCGASKVCYLHFPIFPRANVGSSASHFPWHPKSSPSLETKVHGAET